MTISHIFVAGFHLKQYNFIGQGKHMAIRLHDVWKLGASTQTRESRI